MKAQTMLRFIITLGVNVITTLSIMQPTSAQEVTPDQPRTYFFKAELTGEISSTQNWIVTGGDAYTVSTLAVGNATESEMNEANLISHQQSVTDATIASLAVGQYSGGEFADSVTLTSSIGNLAILVDNTSAETHISQSFMDSEIKASLTTTQIASGSFDHKVMATANSIEFNPQSEYQTVYLKQRTAITSPDKISELTSTYMGQDVSSRREKISVTAFGNSISGRLSGGVGASTKVFTDQLNMMNMSAKASLSTSNHLRTEISSIAAGNTILLSY